MDIRELTLYLHLCDTLHFGRTAEQMHVSPSTLSRILKRLEDEVGSQLFERDNRRVTITTSGTEFQHFAEQTISQWQTLKNNLAPTKQLTGKLKLYCSVTAAYSHLPALLDTFRQVHPLIEITLTTGDAANALQEIQNNRADIAIAALPEPFPSGLHFAHIDIVPLKIISPKIHCYTQALLTEKQIRWQQLPFIIPDHGPGRRRTDTWFKDMGIKGNIYAQVAGYEAITSMVALGCGASIIPDAAINNSPVKNRLLEIESPVTIAPFELGCCCKKQRLNNAIITAFLNVIKG